MLAASRRARGGDRLAGECSCLSIFENQTWPSVSQASGHCVGLSTNASLLMGQVAIIHLPATVPRKVFPVVGRSEEHHVAIDLLAGRAIKHIERSLAIGEGLHAAAAADAALRSASAGVSFSNDLPFVGRMDEPDAAILFARSVAGVPGDVDVAIEVGGHRAAAVQAIRFLNHVSLRFELCPSSSSRVVEHGISVFHSSPFGSAVPDPFQATWTRLAFPAPDAPRESNRWRWRFPAGC